MYASSIAWTFFCTSGNFFQFFRVERPECEKTLTITSLLLLLLKYIIALMLALVHPQQLSPLLVALNHSMVPYYSFLQDLLPVPARLASGFLLCMPSLASSSACSTGSSTIIWVSPLLCAVNFDFFSTPPWLSLPSPSSGFFSPGKIMFKASSRSFGRGPLVGAGPSVIGTRGRNSGCLTTGFSIRLLLFERERVRVRERDTRRRERSIELSFEVVLDVLWSCLGLFLSLPFNCSSSFFSLSLITGCTVFHCCIILSSSWPCFSSSFGLTAAVLSCATVHLLRRTCAATGAAGCVGSCLIFIEGGSAGNSTSSECFKVSCFRIVTRIEAAGLGLSNSLTSTGGRCFFLIGSSSSVVEEDESLVHEELETLPEDFLRLHYTLFLPTTVGIMECIMVNLHLLSCLNAMAYQYFRDPCAPGNANDRGNRVQFSGIYRMFDTNAFRDHRTPISFCLFFMDSMTLFFKRSAELSSSSSSSSSAVTPDAEALALFAALRPGFLSSSFSVVELDEDVEVVSLSVEVSSDDDDDVGFEGVTLRGSCCFTSTGGKVAALLTASFGKVSSSSTSSSFSRFSSPIIPVFCAAHNGALLNPASQILADCVTCTAADCPTTDIGGGGCVVCCCCGGGAGIVCSWFGGDLPNSNASNSAPGGPGGRAFALPKRLSDGCCNIKSSSMLVFVKNES
uniref:Uncharacterized protein n=1 Tax=Glossina pallidipes TaxID=7398 RepID=A0A1B0AIZ8_GLOPL